MACWEWQSEETCSNEVVVRHTHCTSSGFGNTYKYHNTKSIKTVTLEADGMTRDEVDELDAKRQARWGTMDAVLTVTDMRGNEWTGNIRSLGVKGSDSTPLYRVTVSLEIAD